MLAEFGAWWLERMTELAAPLRGNGPADTLLLRMTGQDQAPIVALRRSRGRVQQLGTFVLPNDAPRLRALPRRGERVALDAEATLLSRIVTLPFAAESGLATLLRYEMDRLTPFAADDVLWDWRLLRRDRARATLEAELVLLPRASVAAKLQALAEAGLRCTAVEAALPSGGARALPLEQSDPVAARRTARHRSIAWGICAVMAVVVAVVPLARNWLELRAVEQEIDKLRPAVADAQALQRRINGAATGADAITTGRLRAGDALKALAALTDALPDNTYLTQLSMSQRRLTMEGQTTGSATRLIAALAADSRLRDPGFSAPVVRGDAGNEIFALQAELAR